MTTEPIVYDLAGIGIGPFNLGLAALAVPTPLQCIFFDQKPAFDWHSGIQLPFAKMQVPFLADLVTPTDPTSRYSYLAYLHQRNRFYPFTILEEPYILRSEYEAYCTWVTGQLSSLRFSHTVTAVQYDTALGCYHLSVDTPSGNQYFLARHLVMGIGSHPAVPPALRVGSPAVMHAADYLIHKKELLQRNVLTLVGSGQSAAEIFFDLQQAPSSTLQRVNWCTRSDRFHPMEVSKLTLELTSPDYIRYFHQLSPEQKAATLATQAYLYKGINAELLAAIYRELYQQPANGRSYRLMTHMDLRQIDGQPYHHQLVFRHTQTQWDITLSSEMVILATGYETRFPPLLEGIRDRIRLDEHDRYEVQLNYTIDRDGASLFVQNAELHTHGFNAPDLGMGPYRNAVILNTILNTPFYPLPARIAFQTFDPSDLAS